MKVKKFYVGPIQRGLTFTQAESKLKANPEMVITRRDWRGFHFISAEHGYCIFLKDESILTKVSEENIFDTDKKDWILTYPTEYAKEIMNSILNASSDEIMDVPEEECVCK